MNEIEYVKTVMDTEPKAVWRGGACALNHLGVLWAIDPVWGINAVNAIKLRAASGKVVVEEDEDGRKKCLYMVSSKGIGVIGMFGQMMKGDSKYGGVNTLRTRRALETALRDADVRGVILNIDSPGGTVAGTDELGMAVQQFAASKPIWTFVEDLCASAALWVASQSGKIFMNRAGNIGSVGCFAILYDTSGAAELQGVKVVPLTTGPYKGAGADGTEITDQQKEYFQTLVDASADQFYRELAAGRGIALSKVRDTEGIASGKVWGAKDALEMGLADAVSTFAEVHEKMAGMLDRKAKTEAADRSRRLALVK